MACYTAALVASLLWLAKYVDGSCQVCYLNFELLDKKRRILFPLKESVDTHGRLIHMAFEGLPVTLFLRAGTGLGSTNED
jgi:hypothetical protein